MPPKKKPARRPRVTSGRRKYKKRTGRAFIFTAGFIIIICAGLYSLYFIKQRISTDEHSEGSRQLSISQIEEAANKIDSTLTNSLFDMGISSKDFIMRDTATVDRDGISYEYKSMSIKVPDAIKMDSVVSELNNSFQKEQLLKLEQNKSKRYIVAEIGINTTVTHRVKFDFPKAKPAPKKVVSARPTEKAVKNNKQKSPESLENKSKTKERLSSKNKPAVKLSDKPLVIIIVDDVGQKKSAVDDLLKVNAPLNFAILPGLPYSPYAAEKAHQKGWDVMLHLPMEPKESSGYTARDAGENALLVGFPKKEILSRLDQNLSLVPHVKGINNHMGSKFMENGELVELVLKRVKDRGLYFVDSKTSAGSVGYDTANALGVQALERDIFLDDSSRSPRYIKSQIRKMVAISKSKGYAVGICHPYAETIEAITELVPLIEDEVEIISVTDALAHGRKFGKYQE